MIINNGSVFIDIFLDDVKYYSLNFDEIEDLPDEMWRPIDEKGRYYVSSLGRVKSCQGTKAILLKPYENNHGY